MSRWIDADAIPWQRGSDGDVVVYPDIIADMPTIDIVRCGECKYHYDFPTGLRPITCSISWDGVFENDFCSYGEPQTESSAEVMVKFGKSSDEPPMDEYYRDHDEFYEPQTERSE